MGTFYLSLVIKKKEIHKKLQNKYNFDKLPYLLVEIPQCDITADLWPVAARKGQPVKNKHHCECNVHCSFLLLISLLFIIYLTCFGNVNVLCVSHANKGVKLNWFVLRERGRERERAVTYREMNREKSSLSKLVLGLYSQRQTDSKEPQDSNTIRPNQNKNKITWHIGNN